MDGLPPDVMHDVLEGVLQYEVKQLLLHCVQSKFFTLEQLNHRICCFTYGSSEVSNRPSKISAATLCAEDNSLKQSGMQALMVALYIHVYMSPKVSAIKLYFHHFSFTDVVPRKVLAITDWG